MLYIEFLELDSVAAAQARYPGARVMSWDVRFPITAVEVHEKVAGTELEFGPKTATLPGNNVMKGCFTSRCRVGLRIG
ncbi:MAG: hypothetical protein GQ560_04380 [Dehalococcoidia bacterium]|nr:hypothetical protein [Dehalococcoidia bacterium]